MVSPEAGSTLGSWPPDDGPLCGACGQRHPEGRGACDLDPMNVPPEDDAPEDEKRLKEALYALNRAIMPDDESFTGPTRNARLERIRDEVWDLGRGLYGWTD